MDGVYTCNESLQWSPTTRTTVYRFRTFACQSLPGAYKFCISVARIHLHHITSGKRVFNSKHGSCNLNCRVLRVTVGRFNLIFLRYVESCEEAGMRVK